jgi:hypothetical protein
MSVWYLVAMAAVLLAGLHMILLPAAWVGKGPIPAQSPANVRAMGAMFALLGGVTSFFFTVRILLF